MTLLIALIAVLPAFVWLLLWRLQDQEKEPFRAMAVCFLAGVLASLPFWLAQDWWQTVVGSWSPLSAVFTLALAEELVKALCLVAAIELSHRWFTQIVDGLIYGSAVALGFAFAENLMYLLEFELFEASFAVLYFVRSLNTMVAHSLFTALFGFFYAQAYLRDEIFPQRKREKPWHHFFSNLGEALPLHVTFVHLLPNRPSQHGHYPGSVILEGIIVASVLHGLFNTLLQSEVGGVQLSFVTFPLLFAIAYVVWKVFLASVYRRIVGKWKG